MRLYRRAPHLAILLVMAAAAALAWPARGAAPAEPGRELTLEAIYQDVFQGPKISQMHWLPDGSRLGYLIEDPDGGRELRLANPADGSWSLLLDREALDRASGAADGASSSEIESAHRKRYRVAGYLWAPDGKAILFAGGEGLRLWQPGKGAVALPVECDRADEPAFSPDGTRLAFLHDDDLWVADLDGGGGARRLTRDGSETLLHGRPDWVYREEFDVREGYHWSPDGRYIAFYEFDQQSVPLYPIIDELADPASVRFQRYPRAGDPNSRVRVGIVDVASGKTTWVDRVAEYIPRVSWADADTLAVQLLDRAQERLTLLLVEAATGRSREVLVERDPHWINLSDDLRFLSDSTFLWTSERTGFRHLYRYDREGKLVQTLTSGDWVVFSVEGVNESAGRAYVSANVDGPLGRALYAVPLSGGPPVRVTPETGTHVVEMNPGATAFVDTHSALTRVPRTTVRVVEGGAGVEIHAEPPVDDLDPVTPELVSLTAPDGALVRVKLYRPRTAGPDSRLPVLVYVYGGPGAPLIHDSWRTQTELLQQLLVRRGYVVAWVDDRSSSIPGHRYEVAADHAWGPVAAADHAVAVAYLRSLPYVDPERFAVWGWSGGGTTTCFHMTHTELFPVGIAVAPVTDWRLYDSVYTERYMGLPGDDPVAYRAASILEAAADLHGDLLVIHGTHDDNVHPQNTIRLLEAAVENGRPIDVMLYPNKTHSIYGDVARTHLFEKFLRFLDDQLTGPQRQTDLAHD